MKMEIFFALMEHTKYMGKLFFFIYYIIYYISYYLIYLIFLLFFLRNTQLFTIVVHDRQHGFGIPVAFLMTTTTEPNVFQVWFTGIKCELKKRFNMNYEPTAVVTDQGNIEILAIKTAFPRVKLHFCVWHVLCAWEKKLTKDMLEITNLPLSMQKTEVAKVNINY
jgi:hypothetical protein